MYRTVPLCLDLAETRETSLFGFLGSRRQNYRTPRTERHVRKDSQADISPPVQLYVSEGPRDVSAFHGPTPRSPLNPSALGPSGAGSASGPPPALDADWKMCFSLLSLCEDSCYVAKSSSESSSRTTRAFFRAGAGCSPLRFGAVSCTGCWPCCRGAGAKKREIEEIDLLGGTDCCESSTPSDEDEEGTTGALPAGGATREPSVLDVSSEGAGSRVGMLVGA